MMTKKHLYYILLALFAACFVWVGCRDDVQFVKLSKTTVTVYPKESYQFKVLTDGENLYPGAVVWSIKEETPEEGVQGPVLTIDDTGKVTGVNLGETVVKATLEDGRYLLAVVTVAERVGPKDPTFSFESDKYYIDPHALPDSLAVNIDPDLLKLYPLEFTSSQPDVLEVDSASRLQPTTQEGIYKIGIRPKGQRQDEPVVITGKLGEAEITCEVYVNVRLYLSLMPIGTDLTEIDRNSYRFSINNDDRGKDTIVVYYKAIPDDQATIDRIDFKVSTSGEGLVVNECGLSKNKGEYTVVVTTGGMSGNAVVTVEAVGRKVEANCEVYDKNDYEVESVTMLSGEYTIEDVLYYDLFPEVEVAPFGITDYWPLEWSSSDKEIGTVDNNGYVVFHKPGKVGITATSKDKSATCSFNVLLKVNSVSIEKADDVYYVGTTSQWTTKVEGNFKNNVPEEYYTWTSSNTAVATVDKGLITALDAGTATITVSITDDKGNTVTASKEITVRSAGDIPVYDVNFANDFVYYDQAPQLLVYNNDELDADNLEHYLSFRFSPQVDYNTPRTYTINQDLSGTVQYLKYEPEEVMANLTSGTLTVKEGGKLVFDLKATYSGKTVSITGSAQSDN